MKVKLLKYLRRKVYSQYQVKRSGKLWRIYESPTCSLCKGYETKEQAIDEMKKLWHNVARNYLWEHHTERKQNKYPW